jgi:hypothetical protein
MFFVHTLSASEYRPQLRTEFAAPLAANALAVETAAAEV